MFLALFLTPKRLIAAKIRIMLPNQLVERRVRELDPIQNAQLLPTVRILAILQHFKTSHAHPHTFKVESLTQDAHVLIMIPPVIVQIPFGVVGGIVIVFSCVLGPF